MTKTSRKQQILKDLKEAHGIVSVTCSKNNINRKTFYEWVKTDPKFKNAVDEINETTIDIVEGYLLSLIRDKNPTAIIFYLKTRGRHRGYNEKIDISTHLQPKITFEMFRELFKSNEEPEDIKVVFTDAATEKKTDEIALKPETKSELILSTDGKPIIENKQIVGVVTADIPKGEGILCPDCNRMWRRPKEQNASGIICKTCGKWLRNE